MKAIHFLALLVGVILFAPLDASAQHVSAASQFTITRDAVQHPTDFSQPSTDPADDLTAVRNRIANEATPTQFTADGRVGIPWGEWLSDLLKAIGALAAGAAAWLLARVGPTVRGSLDAAARLAGQSSANELLEKAIGYGINTTAGAVRGQVLTVNVGNEVIERAFEYAIRHAPDLVNMLGGATLFREKIIARVNLEAAAAIPAPRPPAEQLVAEARSTPAASTSPAAA